jgi:hypothetical protein
MIGAKSALIRLAIYFLALFVFGLLWRRRKVSRRIRDTGVVTSDPLLALYGSGKQLWADEHADEYVARLRGGWK